MNNKLKILHISDLHFSNGNQKDFISIAEEISDGIIKEKNDYTVDYICVTGDIFNHSETPKYLEKEDKQLIDNAILFLTS